MTVQTLDPQHFDQGRIIAQTPAPGIQHGCNTVPELLQVMAREGATMLVKCIKDGSFLAPNSPDETSVSNKGPHVHKAPKITPNDRHIDWNTWTANEIMLRQRVIGPLWSILDSGHNSHEQQHRIIWSSGFVEELAAPTVELRPGQPLVMDLGSTQKAVYVSTCDGKTLRVNGGTLEGGKKNDLPHNLEMLGIVLHDPTTGNSEASRPALRYPKYHLL